ncbi:MAG TPA: hypothetical protein VMW75_06265 [Thermoanaerobaculia bacterium]|nr:hypothetical protein [Thermoanaerobaculia bacterium]
MQAGDLALIAAPTAETDEGEEAGRDQADNRSLDVGSSRGHENSNHNRGDSDWNAASESHPAQVGKEPVAQLELSLDHRSFQGAPSR